MCFISHPEGVPGVIAQAGASPSAAPFLSAVIGTTNATVRASVGQRRPCREDAEGLLGGLPLGSSAICLRIANRLAPGADLLRTQFDLEGTPTANPVLDDHVDFLISVVLIVIKAGLKDSA